MAVDARPAVSVRQSASEIWSVVARHTSTPARLALGSRVPSVCPKLCRPRHGGYKTHGENGGDEHRPLEARSARFMAQSSLLRGYSPCSQSLPDRCGVNGVPRMSYE